MSDQISGSTKVMQWILGIIFSLAILLGGVSFLLDSGGTESNEPSVVETNPF